MRDEPVPWKHGVVLVCTNERDPATGKTSCGRERGTRLREQLKLQLKSAGGPAAECRVLGTSCLDVCAADGVTVAVWPGDKVWVVDPEKDRPALIERIQAHMKALAEPAPAPGLRASLKGAVLGKLGRR